MSALKEKIQTLLNNFLGEKDSLTLQEFLNLFEELKPDYDLSEDEVRDIFEMTDEHGEGLIPKSEVERILGAVLTSEDDEKKSFVSDYVNELKAGLAQSAEKGSYTSVLEDFETVNQENNVQDHENTNSALKILHHLDLDKIRELKNIYILCNTQHQGYVELDHLRKVIPTMDNLTCETDEILELFEYIAEGESRIIPKTTFSNLMGELEKKLLDYLVTEENEIMDDLDHHKAEEKEPSEYNTRNFNGVVSSEIFSNSSDKEEYDSANSASEADVKHQTRLIAQKVKNIIEGIKSKTRTEDVITMLHEIVNVSSSLEHQFKHNEGRMKALEQELDEQKNVVDGLNSKVYNFQFTLKNQEQTIYKLQADNDELNQKINVAKNERHLKEHAEAELKEKNNEIVRLERNLNEMRSERSNFIRNIQTIENEKHALTESYKELELLIKKNEQDKREQENIVGAELKKLEERISIERDSLNSQTKTLKDEKASLENDIRNLQATLHEYREQMSTTKEFVDNLNLQKKDLEKQIHKLNDEQANLALEVNRLAFSVQNSPRKNLEFISPFGDSGLTTRHIDQQYNSGFTTMSTPRALNFQFDLKRVEEEEKGHFDIQPEMPKITEIKEELAIPEKKVESLISEKKPSLPKTPRTEPKTIQASESFIKPNAPRTSAKKPNAFTMNLLRPIEPVRAVEPVKPKAPAYNIEVIEASPVRRARKSTMQKHNELLAIIDKRKITMDYLSIKDKPQIINILQKYNEKMEDRIFYSDYVYDIQKEGQREHRIILLTGEALYCLNKNYQVQRRTPLNQIHRVTINQSSVGICAFHVYDDHDYLIDTYKRLELIIFLKTVFKYKGMRPFAIFYEKNFLIHNKGASSSQHVYHYNRKMFNPELQSTYQNVQKVGELYLKEWSIFNPWNKYFFMLTHVGLFYFKEVGNLKPLGFIPILDYLLVNKKESVASDKHEFRIKFQYSDFSVSLAAESELEKLEWVVAIHQVQNKAQQKDILTLIKDA